MPGKFRLPPDPFHRFALESRLRAAFFLQPSAARGAAPRVGAPHGHDGRSRPWGAPTDFRAWVADPNDGVEPRSHRPVDPNVGVRTSITSICRPQRWGPNIDHIDSPTPCVGSKHRSHGSGDPIVGVRRAITWTRRPHRWGRKVDQMGSPTPSMGSGGRSHGVTDPIVGSGSDASHRQHLGIDLSVIGR